MNKLKYIFFVLTTLFIVSCNDDEGYVYSNLYDVVFENQTVDAEVGETITIPFDITKKSGADDFFEITIGETADFNDFKVNAMPFVANQYVKINGFDGANTLSFTALTAGTYKVPVKIRFCGVVTPYLLDVVVKDDGSNPPVPPAPLRLFADGVEALPKNTSTPLLITTRFNKDANAAYLKIPTLRLEDENENTTWQLHLVSDLDIIDKITYRGTDYLPNAFFDFDPAFADELFIYTKQNANYGPETFTIKATNNLGAESNVVTFDFLYYANVTFDATSPLVNGTYTNPGEYFNIASSEITNTGGAQVFLHELQQIKDLTFFGNGAKVKKVEMFFNFYYLDTKMVYPYDPNIPALPDENTLEHLYVDNFSDFEYKVESSSVLPLNQLIYYRPVSGRVINLRSTIQFIVENEFGEIADFNYAHGVDVDGLPYNFDL
ncbi:hypothetical protein K5I29_01820 [Flavobacterium agricola]|uniref:Uncharacterized protein n=1 Tax=Flavobacterium agricola TaxID=2870839 RepID=A0ABY6M220_9FLAO|nr:hypothetical protein [Flavobacterium agricola]UYW01689.1 hypothetical protein K5I29_01820 [Flavobacterium agricola]